MPPNPHLAAARCRRDAGRRAVALLRRWRADRGRYPVLISDSDTADRLVWLASRILTGRCELTGEDPDEVLAGLERGI